jgi:hypothetical protein
MTTSSVLVTASKHNRRFAQPQTPHIMVANPPLLFWRRLLDHAIAEAKKTTDSLPSDLAILARWWIEDLRPRECDKSNWERSFDCACHWLDLDADVERKRILAEIDAELKQKWMNLWFRLTRLRRGMVLTCAGRPKAIASQCLLPLADLATYDEVAGIEKPDMFADMDRDAAEDREVA